MPNTFVTGISPVCPTMVKQIAGLIRNGSSRPTKRPELVVLALSLAAAARRVFDIKYHAFGAGQEQGTVCPSRVR